MHELINNNLTSIQSFKKKNQDFVANISHKLRTPLTVMHGYLEVLLDSNLEDTQLLKKIFTQMHQQTGRMSSLIDDLLLLSQLETHEYTPRSDDKVKIHELLENICDEIKTLQTHPGHHIHLSSDPELYLKGCKNELYSLCSNIIFNAIKYTPPQGTIHIFWHVKNQAAVFTVQDTGIGIAAEHIPRLTERFYRVDQDRSRASGGTGLGLAIAKYILLHHQAELHIESCPGRGSTFTCVFPTSRILLNHVELLEPAMRIDISHK